MARKQTILIVDDHAATRETLAEVIRDEGHLPLLAATARDGLAQLDAEDVDVVLSDLRLPDLDGLELLARAQRAHPETPVVLITGHGSEEVAVAAMRRGAQGYLAKPLDLNRLRAELEGAMKVRELYLEQRRLRGQLAEETAFPELVGSSPRMLELLDSIRQVAPTDATVLIQGENGTGKELVANALYSASRRAGKPFVKVAVAALPRELLESELFGHEKGAFTGAIRQKKGRFELADGGTLFLDEIGELPFETQVKLLRAIEQKTFERVGGTATITSDIRLISATNRDLRAAVEAGRFRRDLYFRINVITLDLPPLRERTEDVPLLFEHFLSLFEPPAPAGAPGAAGRELSPEALAALRAYAWPGNVRELRNVVERLCITSRARVIGPADLPEEIRRAGKDEGGRLKAESGNSTQPSAGSSATLEEVEKEAIRRRLAACGGNKTQAAKSLGIGLKTLYRKLQAYGLE